MQYNHPLGNGMIQKYEKQNTKKNENIVSYIIGLLQECHYFFDSETFIDLFQFIDTPFFQEGCIYNVIFNYTVDGLYIPLPQEFTGIYIRQINMNDLVIFRDENGSMRYVKVRYGNYFSLLI